MLRKLKQMLGRGRAADRNRSEVEALQVACAALLLESAAADDRITPEEREPIELGLASVFDLDEEGVRALLERAEHERREAIDLHGFTSVIVRRWGGRRRIALAELIWRVVYADGRLTRRENVMALRLSKLLDLRPEQVISVRRAAARRPRPRP